MDILKVKVNNQWVGITAIKGDQGVPGAKGDKGDKGDRGNPGPTPALSIGTVTDVPYGTGSSATITGTAENPVLNLNLQSGASGNETIDDTAGVGDTDKVWSADKVVSELDEVRLEKADVIGVVDDTAEAVKMIPDGADGEPMALTVGIEPVQDLHGYDNPWPAGGGKNLIPDGTDTNNGYVAGNILRYDGLTQTVSGYYVSEYFAVQPSTNYVYSHNASEAPDAPAVCFYDENKQFISDSGTKIGRRAYVAVQSPSNAVYARTTQSATYIMQLETGTTPTQASPYSNICPISGWTGCNVTVSTTQDAEDGTTYSITFPSSAGTVYGGELTVNKDGTGELTVNRGMVDLSALGWATQKTLDDYTLFTFRDTSWAREAETDTILCNVLRYRKYTSSYYTPTASTVTDFIDKSMTITDTARLYAWSSKSSASAFKSWLSEIGAYMVIKLQTAVPYELTAEQITSILGTNNIFVDTGDILSVDYSADTKMYVDAGDESTQEQITLTREMIADSDAVIVTESHAIGDVFICNDQLLRATDAIATGETVVIGSNAEVINLADYIKEQVTDIAVLRTDIDTLKELPVSMNDILLKKLGFSDFVSESSSYGRITLRGNVLTAKATSSGSTYYHINLLGTHRVKSGTWGNYNPLPEDFSPIDDLFKSAMITEKNRKYCLRTVGEVKSGSGTLRLVVMKDNGDDTYTYKYTPITMTMANIALLDGEPLDIREWDGISLVLTSQSRPNDIKVILSVEEGDGGTYSLDNK